MNLYFHSTRTSLYQSYSKSLCKSITVALHWALAIWHLAVGQNTVGVVVEGSPEVEALELSLTRLGSLVCLLATHPSIFPTAAVNSPANSPPSPAAEDLENPGHLHLQVFPSWRAGNPLERREKRGGGRRGVMVRGGRPGWLGARNQLGPARQEGRLLASAF